MSEHKSGGSKLSLQLINSIMLFAICCGGSYIGKTTLESSKQLERVNSQLEEMKSNQTDFKEDLRTIGDRQQNLFQRVTRIETKQGLP